MLFRYIGASRTKELPVRFGETNVYKITEGARRCLVEIDAEVYTQVIIRLKCTTRSIFFLMSHVTSEELINNKDNTKNYKL